jgi:hypothetical protein
MSDSELLVQRPSLRSVIATISLFALNTAGLIIFIPSGYFLATSADAQIPDWLSWLIPLGLWCSGYLPLLRAARAHVQVAAGLLLVLMSLVVPEGPSWIPVGVVSFAVIVAAVFNLPTRSALVVVLLAAGLDLLSMESNAASIGLFGVGLIAPWAGALLNLIAGGGILIAWTAWNRKVLLVDIEFDEIRAARAIEEQAIAAETGAEAVRRRIHETILNTLAGISMGLPPEAQHRAEATCQHDLEQLRRGLDRLDDASISTIIAAAQQALEPTALVCTVHIPRDVTITAGVANALRDAITESLRNVERHSGVLRASIHAEVTDEVVIVISDHGRGPAPSAQERFGVRNAVRANLSAIGGSASMNRGVTGGTEVTLHAPLSAPMRSRVPTFPVVGVADSTIWGRLGVTGTNVYTLLLMPFIITEFAAPGLTALAIAAYVACMLLLALMWTSAIKMLLVVIGIALLPLPFLAAGSGTLTCVAAPGIQGLITGMAGGGVMLLLIAAPRTWLRAAITTLAFTASLWLAMQLPSNCVQETLLSVGVNAIYMITITVVLTWIDLRFEARRTDAQLEWERVLDERIARERRSAEEASWLAVPSTTRSLLEEIAAGRIHVADLETQSFAAQQAEILRSSIGLSSRHSATLDHLCDALSPAARQAGTSIEVEALMTGHRRDPLPSELVSFLDDLIRTNSPSSITIRTIMDDDWEDYVVVMPATYVTRPVPDRFADVLVELGYEDGVLHISFRRPGSRT